MKFDRFFKFSQLLLDDQFVLSYSGHVSEDILLAVGETLRARLQEHAKNRTQIRNIFSIFVELMQNIIRYGVASPPSGPPSKFLDKKRLPFGVVTITDDGGHLSVLAGNFVQKEEADLLHQRIRELEISTQDQLRALYRGKLHQPAEEQSKGASLGLIEIARRSSTPLTCKVESLGQTEEMGQVEDTGNSVYFFMIKASVKG